MELIEVKNTDKYIVVKIKGQNTLYDYMKALELLDEMFDLDLEWQLLQQKKKDKY
jgi:antitoxin component HigA of HigAB toxin-antitoxin module